MPIQFLAFKRIRSRANYSTALDANVLALVDYGTGMNVTNDAEAVIEEVASLISSRGYDINRYVVIYRDIMGRWGEMKIRNGRFAGLAPLAAHPVTDYAEARLLARRHYPEGELVCQQCRRVCFSEREFLQHDCGQFADQSLAAEISLVEQIERGDQIFADLERQMEEQ